MQQKEEIEKTFREHYPKMYQLARVLLKDDAASKDVVSDVFANMLNAKVTLRPESIGDYLLVCVRNKCFNLLSRQKMKDRVHCLLQAEVSHSIVPVETVIASKDKEQDKLEEILAYVDTKLTPQTRKVFHFRFRQQMTYREIAFELGITEVAVYKHLAHGIKKLQQQFNP